MPRTPLLRSVVKLAREHQRAAALGLPIGAFREKAYEARAKYYARKDEATFEAMKKGASPNAAKRGFSRRGFLGGAAAAAAATVALPRLARASHQPRIAIVGGGIAGMSAARRFADQGVVTTVYESSNRIGGRMFSNRTFFDQGQVFEWAGELIDSNHATLHYFCDRFGLTLDDLRGNEPPGSAETYFFNGRFYPKHQADEDFYDDVYPALHADIAKAGYPTNVFHSTADGRALDLMSVYDWIESRVPGGHSSPMGELLDTAYYIEYNSDTREQSALNLLYLLAYQPDKKVLEMFGLSDEKWHVQGGNDQIPNRIAESLPEGTLRMGMRMEAIERTPAGAYRLTFARSNRTTEVVTADVVLLCCPFAVLRTLDYSRAGFDDQKHYAIQNLGAGRQSKQHLQFTRRVWYDKLDKPDIGNGSSYGDTGYQATWETSRAQPGTAGILVGYAGGAFADAMSSKVAWSTSVESKAAREDAQRFLQQAEPVYRGLTAAWNGKSTQGLPHLDPHLNCSYSFFKTGGYQTIGAYERVRQGNVWFAGEHCSMDFQGFMEGGAIEGWNAVKAILQDTGNWGNP